MKLPNFDKFIPSSEKSCSTWAIALTAVSFFSINIISNSELKNARIDLTEDQLFTITEGTKEVLSSIDEPIDVRLYYSKSLDSLAPGLNSHVRRVTELIEEYERRSDGKFNVTHIDPLPYSVEEDMAESDGLAGLPIRGENTVAYFGLSATNSTDDQAVIEYFSPDRADFLEYDLTRIVHDLANPEKPVVGVIGDLPFYGDQSNQFQRMTVLSKIEESFKFERLDTDIKTIDENVDVLMVAQPNELGDDQRYAIDQFALKGGRILAMVDPFAETLAQPGPMGAAASGNSVAAMKPLFDAWGVEIPEGKIIGDAANSMRVVAQVRGQQTAINYLPWIGLGNDMISNDDVVTSELRRLTFNSSGYIKKVEAGETDITPLIVSSDQSQIIDVEKIQFRPDPAAILSEFAPTGESYNIAARVTGKIKSAFPDGPPSEAREDDSNLGDHLAESTSDLNLILVADADFLNDRNWIEQQSLFGSNLAIPTANNGDLIVNALENLSGSDGLINLRSKGVTDRPFTVIAAMEQEAEQKYRAKEQELLDEIDAAKQKIVDLQQKEKETGILLTSTQKEEIQTFQANMLDLRQELRGVQSSLREDVDGLKTTIAALNIWGVPVLMGLGILGLAMSKRMGSSRKTV